MLLYLSTLQIVKQKGRKPLTFHSVVLNALSITTPNPLFYINTWLHKAS